MAKPQIVYWASFKTRAATQPAAKKIRIKQPINSAIDSPFNAFMGHTFFPFFKSHLHEAMGRILVSFHWKFVAQLAGKEPTYC
ncbi:MULTISPECIES: hypothetical protein [unclassified Peribacillus]|uniref:hypothetical protein n=1 Tax=unclassified Peribacillus TaxID=2675266 RepID=UPI001F4DEE9E|nr:MULTISPECIES: hypothetical protein [unclassified Peribacillus]MCK1986070.1 hypothetical protein [Peribacillus sp. Aquil_B1]MCK2011416.1 hypothetical protein [Peribacillus sp. Aquil_B8]